MNRRRTLLLALAAGLWTVAAAASLPAQQTSPEARQEIQNAQSLIGHGQYKEAVKVLEHANQLERDACAPCDFLLGETYARLRDYKKAAESAAAALQLAGNNELFAAAAHNLKGLALLGQTKLGDAQNKRLLEAEGEFRAALALTAGLPVVHYNLGVALLRQKRDPEGIAELETYLKRPVPPDHVAEARRMLADPRRAREAFAPDFSFTTLDGEVISSDALRGKVILLDFWGTWCEACLEAEPAIASLYKKFSRKPFELIAISSDTDDAAWRSFIAKNKMIWPEYRDGSNQILHAFSIYYFPTYVVIDPDGVIRHRSSGYGQGTYSDLEDAIRRALEPRVDGAKEHPAAGRP